MKFGSLFSGVGGFDLGLERSGMHCAWQVEIDEFCTKVLEEHWPDVPRYKDVRDVGRENLEPVDLICERNQRNADYQMVWKMLNRELRKAERAAREDG